MSTNDHTSRDRPEESADIAKSQKDIDPNTPPDAAEILIAELSRHLDAMKEFRQQLRARRDIKGVRIVNEWIRAKKEQIDRLDMSNYGGDV